MEKKQIVIISGMTVALIILFIIIKKMLKTPGDEERKQLDKEIEEQEKKESAQLSVTDKRAILSALDDAMSWDGYTNTMEEAIYIALRKIPTKTDWLIINKDFLEMSKRDSSLKDKDLIESLIYELDTNEMNKARKILQKIDVNI